MHHKFVFLGTSAHSIVVLEELLRHGHKPSLIITAPDKPQGRGMRLMQNVVSSWGEEHEIESWAEDNIRTEEFVDRLRTYTSANDIDYFLVACYGKMIPSDILNIPRHKVINIHPSLLPKYRGASPIISQILADEKALGTTLIVVEERMDAGPIIVQRKIEASLDDFATAVDLRESLFALGAQLLAHVIDEWCMGVASAIPQSEAEATYCKKFAKEDGLTTLDEIHSNPRQAFLKFKAFLNWPTTYYFDSTTGKRIKIVSARLGRDIRGKDVFEILEVVREGGRRMPYADYVRGMRTRKKI